MRRLALIALVAVTGLLAAGCGASHETNANEEATTEGVYLEQGGLTYQIQMSRYLNPADIEDKAYLEGLPAGTTPPGRDDIWFGVWMRVKNYSGATATPTTQFKITDTQKDVFTPVSLSPSNPFSYQPVPIPHAGVLPQPSSAAGSGPIQGSLILFRLKIETLQNRPFVLHIAGGASVQLDL
jgi:hypothetical protein